MGSSTWLPGQLAPAENEASPFIHPAAKLVSISVPTWCGDAPVGILGTFRMPPHAPNDASCVTHVHEQHNGTTQPCQAQRLHTPTHDPQFAGSKTVVSCTDLCCHHSPPIRGRPAASLLLQTPTPEWQHWQRRPVLCSLASGRRRSWRRAGRRRRCWQQPTAAESPEAAGGATAK